MKSGLAIGQEQFSFTVVAPFQGDGRPAPYGRFRLKREVKRDRLRAQREQDGAEACSSRRGGSGAAGSTVEDKVRRLGVSGHGPRRAHERESALPVLAQGARLSGHCGGCAASRFEAHSCFTRHHERREFAHDGTPAWAPPRDYYQPLRPSRRRDAAERVAEAIKRKLCGMKLTGPTRRLIMR